MGDAADLGSQPLPVSVATTEKKNYAKRAGPAGASQGKELEETTQCLSLSEWQDTHKD